MERRDERFYITDKRERTPLEFTPDDWAAIGDVRQSAVVIVGAGAAGSAAAEMLRRSGYAGRITMIDEEEAAPYDRPNLSKDYLAGTAPEAWIPLRPPSFYEQHDISQVRSRVRAIDVPGQTVHVADGSSHSYEALLLATGAEPRQLDIPGHELAHLHKARLLRAAPSLHSPSRRTGP